MFLQDKETNKFIEAMKLNLAIDLENPVTHKVIKFKKGDYKANTDLDPDNFFKLTQEQIDQYYIQLDDDEADLTKCDICDRVMMPGEDEYIDEGEILCDRCFKKRYPTDYDWDLHLCESNGVMNPETIDKYSYWELKELDKNDVAELAAKSTEDPNANSYYTTVEE